MKNKLEKLKKALKKFFSIKDTPHRMALGFSLGVFWGIMPGEGVLTTLLFAALSKANKSSSLAGVLGTNMWSTFAVLPLSALFGGALFNSNPTMLMQSFEKNHANGLLGLFSKLVLLDVALPLLSGFFIVSMMISLACYFLVYAIFKYKQIIGQ